VFLAISAAAVARQGQQAGFAGQAATRLALVLCQRHPGAGGSEHDRVDEENWRH
jgi:hypothetical protein